MDEALCCGAPEHPCGVRGTRLSESHRAKAPVLSILSSTFREFPVWEFLFFFVFPIILKW